MVDLVNPTAVILAGGLGTRLRSIIENQPKVLAEVSGHPFLKYILDQLIAWQIKDVVLCTGHLGEQIEARFGTDYQGLRLRYSRESDTHENLFLSAPLARCGWRCPRFSRTPRWS